MLSSFVITKISSKRVNCFNPLLDPYLGQYKDKLNYWTVLKPLMRDINLFFFDNTKSLISGFFYTGALLCGKELHNHL